MRYGTVYRNSWKIILVWLLKGVFLSLSTVPKNEDTFKSLAQIRYLGYRYLRIVRKEGEKIGAHCWVRHEDVIVWLGAVEDLVQIILGQVEVTGPETEPAPCQTALRTINNPTYVG